MRAKNMYESASPVFIGTPTYLDSYHYPDSDSDVSSSSDTFVETPECEGQDIFLVVCVTLMYIVSRSFSMSLLDRMYITGYVPIYIALFEYFLINLCCWPIVFFKICVTKSIKKEERKFSKCKFLLLAFLDWLSISIRIVPFKLLPEPAGVIVDVLLLIINIGNSNLFLNQRQTFYQYSGLSGCFYGILIIVYSGFQYYTDVTGIQWWGYIIIVFLLFISHVLKSFSLILKEKWLKKHNMDCMYMMAWTSLFHWVLHYFTILFTFVPIHPFRYIDVKEFPNVFVSSMKCFFSVDGSQCSFLWVVFFLFFALSLISHYCELLLYKKTSSNTVLVSQFSTIPLSHIALLWTVIAGNFMKLQFNPYDIVAFFILLISALIYLGRKEKKASLKNDILLKIKKCYYCKKNPNRENTNSGDWSANRRESVGTTL